MSDFQLQHLQDKKMYVQYFTKVCIWSSIVARGSIEVTIEYLIHLLTFVQMVEKIFGFDLAVHSTTLVDLFSKHTNCKPLLSSQFQKFMENTPKETVVEIDKQQLLKIFNVENIGYSSTIHKAKWSYPFWYVIHITSISTDNVHVFTQFMNSIPYILPCKLCKQHSIEFILNNKIVSPFFLYTTRLHQHSKHMDKLSNKEYQRLLNMYQSDLKPLYNNVNQFLNADVKPVVSTLRVSQF